LRRFRDILTSAARQDFDAGVVALTAGDFVKAEQSFKSAQRAGSISGNGTAPLTYLAATYAASGHDLEAANVWQTALIDGSAYPQIYEWLTDALIRVRNLELARGTLKEALEKWPNDSRFISRLSELERAPGGR
jgi:tetratricopeptide (TPR) repeat protein